VLQGEFRGSSFEGLRIGAVANNEYVCGVETTPGHGQIAVTAVGGHYDVAENEKWSFSNQTSNLYRNPCLPYFEK